MAWIYERYQYDKRIQLGKEEILRPLGFGTNWLSIRIGIRYSMNQAARATYQYVNNYGFGYYLGVCQGMTGSILSETGVDWIGGGMIGNVWPANGQITTYTAGTPGYCSMTFSRPNALWKVGTTNTFATESSVGWFITDGGVGGAYAGQYMSAIYVDIAKGPVNYTITPIYTTNATSAQTNVTNAVFIAAMETTATPANMTAPTGKTIAYTGQGLFDTLSVASARCWPNIEIDMIAVTRFT